MPEPDIKYFLCYASDDLEFALNLAEKLRSHNANVWMDKLDLRGGQLWDDGIEKALEECQGMILVISPSSVASQNVKDEMSYAFDDGMTIIPVLYKKCKIPYRIRRIHYVDFTGSHETGFAVLLRSLNAKKVENTLTADEKGKYQSQLNHTSDKYYEPRQIKQTVPHNIQIKLWVVVGIAIISVGVWYWEIPNKIKTYEQNYLKKTLSETDQLLKGVGSYDEPMLGGDFAQSSILQKFIEDISEKYNISINYLYGVFSNVKSRRIIHEAYERNIEPSWISYRDIFIYPDRVEQGRVFRKTNMDTHRLKK